MSILEKTAFTLAALVGLALLGTAIYALAGV
jgi:hypothetical protein